MGNDNSREAYYHILKQFIATDDKEQLKKIISENKHYMTSDFLSWLLLGTIPARSSGDAEQIAITKHVEMIRTLIRSELSAYFDLLKQICAGGDESVRFWGHFGYKSRRTGLHDEVRLRPV